MTVTMLLSALFILFFSVPTLGLHQEPHCGKEWITFRVVGYSIGGKYTPYRDGFRLVTRRKSEIESIIGIRDGGTWKVNLVRKDTAVANWVTQESRDAIIRCLE